MKNINFESDKILLRKRKKLLLMGGCSCKKAQTNNPGNSPQNIYSPPVYIVMYKCKVQGCSENHAQHHCKICNSPDSNHFSSYCPQAANRKNRRCRVSQCTENHLQHYCNICQEKDADHFSSNCSQANQRQNPHCKVPQCRELHLQHYCRNCDTDDVDHFANKCPKPSKRCKVMNF